ncbi:APC family permease [Haematomicrobium sanguinis]|uniref:APC family permease n=1 Tax=Haematomicrobium sanguinis TaxID=479106 RepID=UPI00047D4AB8|nr:APC family permease [Haematomicrobium sanguinis]
MLTFLDALKRVLVGKPFHNERLRSRELPTRIALPIYSSNSWSSVAYSPDEIILTLSLAGVSAVTLAPWVGLAVVLVMLVVIASYRQSLLAYPKGGGDYKIARKNLGDTAGIAVASALTVDFVLTVVVSTSSAATYVASAIPALQGKQVWVAVAAVVVLILLNLRGVKRGGRFFALMSYLFLAVIAILCAAGFIQAALGILDAAVSSGYQVTPEEGLNQGLTGLAGAILVLRAFSTGAAALTGLEGPANNVAEFPKPRARNAATTLLLMGVVAAAITLPVIILARLTRIHVVQDPANQLTIDGAPPPADFFQMPVLAQLAQTIFEPGSIVFYVLVGITALVLMLAAHAAFSGFPELGSTLAQDGFLPKQLRTRGDRLSYSNGVLALGIPAIALILVFNADVTRLIQVYIVGVFLALTLGQLGMVRHWSRTLHATPGKRLRLKVQRSRAINFLGFLMTASVLVVVLVTKFVYGAWVAVLAIAALSLIMYSIHAHYRTVAQELAITEDTSVRALPSRVHALILVSHVRKPVLRALAFARASRPSTLEAIVVDVDPEDTAQTLAEWDTYKIPVPITVLESPYRETVGPILRYIKELRASSPRDLIVVYIPEYVVGRWWEQLVHNQTALRIKTRLHFEPGVMVASVPWQLKSSETAHHNDGE